MQINFVIFVLLASICLISVTASPIGDNKRNKRMLVKEPSPIREPGWPVYHLCGYIGDTCMNNTDCCSNNACGQPAGNGDNSLRCCGMTGATGCNATVPYNTQTSGCCSRYYCAPPQKAGGTTMCMEILTK